MPYGFKKAKYYSSVAGLYLLSLLIAVYLFKPFSLGKPAPVAAQVHRTASYTKPDKPLVSGTPVRIVIPTLGIDLPVDKGYYNPSDNSWSLSGYHAQFAILSASANNTEGNTFIYGHNNPYVFGPLKHITGGVKAQLYTANHHVFSYVFKTTKAVVPDNISILNYQGPPIMTIQTCSGVWNEQRQMYTFQFKGVSS